MFDRFLLIDRVRHVVSFSQTVFIKETVKSAIFEDYICYFIEKGFYKPKVGL